MTWVRPSSLPMASAVRWLSPVSMTTLRPSFWKPSMAARLVGFTVSATAMMPMGLPSWTKNRGVLPCRASWSAIILSWPRSTPAPDSMAALPARYFASWISP